ncbi:WD repeat-containing protein 6, partial [Perkinsus chesapeaki]
MVRDHQDTLPTMAYHGPILAVEDLKDQIHMTIAVGMGPYLHFTQGEGNRTIYTKQLFTHDHIHGMRLCDDGTLIAWATTHIVFGTIQRDPSTGQITGFTQSSVVDCEDWVLSALSIKGAIYVSTMHNELVVIDVTSGLIKARLQAPSRAILYSSHIACLGENKEDMIVVGGSVRWTCPVWQPYGISEFREVEVHQGSVFSVKVYPGEVGGPLVLSSSDDRTAVLWRLADGAVMKTYAQGHGGRVWVALLCQRGVLTACEDAVVRLFDRKTAKCLKEFHGHRHGGHGVRALTTSHLKGAPYAVSGGEDAALKPWDLSKAPEVQSKTVSLPPTGKTARKDWIRWVGFLEGFSHVCVVTNFGTVYTYYESDLSFECEIPGAPVVAAALSKSFLWLGTVSGGVVVADRQCLREQHAFPSVVRQQASSIFTGNSNDDTAVVTNRLGDVSIVSPTRGVIRKYKVSGKKTACCTIDDDYVILGTANGAIWVLSRSGSVAPSESRLFGNKTKVVSIRVTTVGAGKRQVACSGNDGVLVMASWQAFEDGRIAVRPIYSIRVQAVQHLLGVARPTPQASSRLAWGFTETSFVVWDVDNLVERWK